ncbi:MAG: hypothetical protein Q9188_005185, partial [Gyalolechia gomerana]
ASFHSSCFLLFLLLKKRKIAKEKAKRANTPPPTAPPIIAAEGEELESGLEEEMEGSDGSDGSEEDVVCGTGAGVVMMEVRRTRDVIPLVEAVEERVMVVSWEVVVEARLGTWFRVSGVVGDKVAACTEEESGILVVGSEDRGGDGGLVLVVGGRSGNEVGLLLLLLLEPPDAAAGAPSLAIDAREEEAVVFAVAADVVLVTILVAAILATVVGALLDGLGTEIGVVFLIYEQVAETVVKALPVERTTDSAFFGGTRGIGSGEVTIGIITILRSNGDLQRTEEIENSQALQSHRQHHLLAKSTGRIKEHKVSTGPEITSASKSAVMLRNAALTPMSGRLEGGFGAMITGNRVGNSSQTVALIGPCVIGAPTVADSPEVSTRLARQTSCDRYIAETGFDDKRERTGLPTSDLL